MEILAATRHGGLAGPPDQASATLSAARSTADRHKGALTDGHVSRGRYRATIEGAHDHRRPDDTAGRRPDPGPSVANLETIISLCKRRGYIFPSSEIYGGINAVWDYGPLGVEFKNNVKRAWWDAMIQERDDIVGLDASILMAPACLAGLRPRGRLHRPDGGLHRLQAPLPRRPGARGGLIHERATRRSSHLRPEVPVAAARSPRRASST